MKPFKQYFNNDGHTLVTVLLMMVIFMALGLSFMGQSLNTTKQTAIVESKIQAVDLAEMGTQFYTNYINNELEEIKKEIQKDVNAYLQSEMLDGYEKDEMEAFLTERAIAKAKNILSNKTYSNVEKTIENNDTRTLHFTIENILFNGNAITFDAIGSVDGVQESTISSALHIDFNSMIVSIGGGNVGNVKWNLLDLIDPDEIFTSCGATQTVFDKEKCEYDGRDFENNDKPTFNKSVFKINGDLTLPNINNSNLGNSTFYIKDNFYNTNNLNDTSNYTLYIGGIAKIGNLNNATNVKICVNELNALGEMNKKSDVKIYAKVNNTDKSNVITDEDAFKNYCYAGSTNVHWIEPIMQEEYNYNN